MAHPQAERMLSGQSAIVTGSGSGLGEAAAIALADAGARVIVTDLPSKLDHAQRVVDRIRAAEGHAIAAPLDVRDLDLVQGVVDAATDAFGRLDILVNNAGAIFDTRQVSADGVEMTWALNHLAERDCRARGPRLAGHITCFVMQLSGYHQSIQRRPGAMLR